MGRDRYVLCGLHLINKTHGIVLIWLLLLFFVLSLSIDDNLVAAAPSRTQSAWWLPTASTSGTTTGLAQPRFQKRPQRQQHPLPLFLPLLVRGGASKERGFASSSKTSSRSSSSVSVSSSHSQSAAEKKKMKKKKKIAANTNSKMKTDSKATTVAGGGRGNKGLLWFGSEHNNHALLRTYQRMLPLTRMYLTLMGLATLVGAALGQERTQSLFALDARRVFYNGELWRVFTSATFLGPPSIGWLMNGYYLFEYGSALERAYGSAQHLLFLSTQMTLLSILSILTGQPFFANSIITAMLHVLSRALPHQTVKWLIFTVPYWTLPYALMITDVLQSQNASAALPHVLGILSGHFYHFHKFIWPRMHHVNHHTNAHKEEDWLVPPTFLQQKLEPTQSDSDRNKTNHRARNQKTGRTLRS